MTVCNVIMTVCNYCMLQGITRVAAKAGGTVAIRPAPDAGFPDGVEVLICYPNDDMPAFAAWFAKLPDHCVC